MLDVLLSLELLHLQLSCGRMISCHKNSYCGCKIFTIATYANVQVTLQGENLWVKAGWATWVLEGCSHSKHCKWMKQANSYAKLVCHLRCKSLWKGCIYSRIVVLAMQNDYLGCVYSYMVAIMAVSLRRSNACWQAVKTYSSRSDKVEVELEGRHGLCYTAAAIWYGICNQCLEKCS